MRSGRSTRTSSGCSRTRASLRAYSTGCPLLWMTSTTSRSSSEARACSRTGWARRSPGKYKSLFVANQGSKAERLEARCGRHRRGLRIDVRTGPDRVSARARAPRVQRGDGHPHPGGRRHAGRQLLLPRVRRCRIQQQRVPLVPAYPARGRAHSTGPGSGHPSGRSRGGRLSRSCWCPVSRLAARERRTGRDRPLLAQVRRRHQPRSRERWRRSNSRHCCERSAPTTRRSRRSSRSSRTTCCRRLHRDCCSTRTRTNSSRPSMVSPTRLRSSNRCETCWISWRNSWARRSTSSSPTTATSFYLLQCRPQSRSDDSAPSPIPKDIPDADVVFTADRHVSNGWVPDITHIVYVDPDSYGDLASREDMLAVARAVGKLNRLLPKKRFILLGPGRWGSRGDV